MIYVDEYPGTGWGKWQGGGHLLTSDVDELHEFARRLRLHRDWFQLRTCPHYDLTFHKRNQAILLGATSIGFGEFPADMLWCHPRGGFETTAQRFARTTKWSE